ncbi:MULTISPECIES: ABC transporter permease [unclassified Oceanispirochaeta]|uniref:ABC transporter permease n=1 Tax=unclassified Oceanispirochaeta TaxID=2635722 RepID=UPI000E09CD0C|nr:MULTISPECIES: ABC transporter permease [unclassified Oceanispirochaeta]MBF9014087.1 ABC transporter permease [Oceanispirochaeta sp. M2]NPD70578.1 ABC transporter permease [Oceanispirochaeta sp. M1]RDG34344.1 ABC transporter permease [Oceanispirochaeta sp. M1]
MIRYILKRLVMLFPTLFGVVTLVFFMIALSPGDPARVMLGERASKEKLEKLRADLGLDKPLIEQYGLYLKRIVRLDFGKSIKSGQKVWDEVKARYPATIELALCAMIFASVLGVWIGVISATKKNTWIDYTTMVGALLGVSMPVFWLALVMIMVFSVNLNMFPTGGRMNLRLYFTPETNFYLIDTFKYLLQGKPEYILSALHHLVLPSIALGTIPLAIIARTTRSSMLEVLKQDYVKTVRSSGIKERRVVFRYALRNALLPVITVIGLQFGMLLAGALLTETIFAWPGIGKWIYHAIEARDYPAVQGGIIVISTSFVLINLIVDVLYSVINPKIRLQ